MYFELLLILVVLRLDASNQFHSPVVHLKLLVEHLFLSPFLDHLLQDHGRAQPLELPSNGLFGLSWRLRLLRL